MMNFKTVILMTIILSVTIIMCKPDNEQVNQAECLYCIYSLQPEEEYGYVDLKGDTVIPLGKYTMCYTDTFCTFAIVVIEGKGFVGINREEKVIFQVFPFDNGPDNVSNGLFRIIDNGKIGFADTSGNVVISPQFVAAFPFHDDMAAYSNDCKMLMEGEHSKWDGGKWGFIAKDGTVATEPIFDAYLQGFSNGTAKMKLGEKTVTINKKGEVVR